MPNDEPVHPHAEQRVRELQERYRRARDLDRIPITASYLSNGLQHLHDLHPDGVMPWTATWLAEQLLAVQDEVMSRIPETDTDYVQGRDDTDQDDGVWNLCTQCDGAWRPDAGEEHEEGCPIPELRTLRRRVRVLESLASFIQDGWEISLSYHDDLSGPKKKPRDPRYPKVFSAMASKFVDDGFLCGKGKHGEIAEALRDAMLLGRSHELHRLAAKMTAADWDVLVDPVNASEGIYVVGQGLVEFYPDVGEEPRDGEWQRTSKGDELLRWLKDFAADCYVENGEIFHEDGRPVCERPALRHALMHVKTTTDG